MSKNRKNNHYHYAEKFDDKRRHARSGLTAYMPFKAVIVSLIVLLMFGLVSTTFATYVTDNEPDYNPEDPAIISAVRNIKASRDIAVSGANVEVAESGWSFSGTSYLYFDNTTTNWSDTYICLVIGKSSYSSVYRMTKVTNTNYYVVQFPSSGWSDASYMAIIGTSSLWGDGNWGSSNLSNATHRSAEYKSGIDTSNNQRYTFTPSSASNGCTLTLAYRGTDNGSMDLIALKAHACYSNTGASNSYTADNATGGTVKISSYYFSAYNTVSTSDTDTDGASASYDAAKTNASTNSTFTATAANGYVFKGWYDAANGGSSVSANATYSYSTNSGNKEIYARFLKQNTVTIAKSPNAYTGSPTVDSSTTSKTVDAGVTVTLSADVKTGVTFNGWTFSNSSYSFSTGYNANSNPCVIKPTANVTATARYTLQVPTSLSLSYPTIVAGNTSTPTKSATSPSGGTLSYSYSIAPSAGTTAASGTYSVNSSGVVSATIPGKYTVTMSVTTSAYGLTSAASSKTAEVTVKPAAPSASVLSYTVDGWTDDYTEGTTGTVYTTPIKVPIRSESFTITAWLTSTITGYTYDWTNVTGTYNTSNGAVSAIQGAQEKSTTNYRSIDLCTDSDSALIVDSDGHYAYQINVIATYNGVSSDATSMVLYYDVISDFLDIQYMSFTADTNDYQKIYAEDNGINSIVSTIRAGGTTFNTLSMFSKDNINYVPMEVWTALGSFVNSFGTFTPTPDDAAHRTSDLQETFNLFGSMGYTGPKWFRIYMNDTGNLKTASATRYIHTTVGTSSTVANHPIYYKDDTGGSYSNSRVMAFYLVSSEANVHYQTAQVIKDSSDNIKHYRFYIPSDATQITFAHVSNNNYVLPTYDNGAFTYAVYRNNTVLMAWTETVNLTDSANAGKFLYTATAATEDSTTHIKNYTGSMSTLN